MTKYNLSEVSKTSIKEITFGWLTFFKIPTSVSIISSFPSTNRLSMTFKAYSTPVSRFVAFLTIENVPLFFLNVLMFSEIRKKQ